MSHVFISHATTDATIARQIYDRLEASGIESWLATPETLSDDNWEAQVDAALQTASLCLLLLSDAALKSPSVTYEYRYFLNHGIPLLPLLIEPLDDPGRMPSRLQTMPQMDMTNNFEEQLAALISELRTRKTFTAQVKPSAQSGFLPDRSQVKVTVNIPRDTINTDKYAELIGKLADIGIENIQVDEAKDG